MKRASLFVSVFLLFVGTIFIYGCGSNLPQWRGRAGEVGPKFVEEGVEFSIYAPNAKKVTIAGDFNGWSKVADPLSDRDGDGIWKIIIPLKPGRYEYKFVVDDRWIADPSNPKMVDDGFGGKNSVIVVGKR